MSIYSLYALLGATSFAFSSIIFRHFGRQVSPYWVNALKNTFALLAFALTLTFTQAWTDLPRPDLLLLLAASGLLGLFLGDYYLIKAFTTVGPSRTFMIFNFEPIFLGIAGYLFFNQSIENHQLVSIGFLLACVFILTLEMLRNESPSAKQDRKGLLYAFIMVVCDSIGLILTKQVFDQDPSIGTLEANFYRCLAAAFGFAILSRFLPLHLFKKLFQLKISQRGWILLACFMGTYLGLLFRLAAITEGHLATVMAVGGTSPLVAAIIECVVDRCYPSRYLIIALVLFGLGFANMVWHS